MARHLLKVLLAISSLLLVTGKQVPLASAAQTERNCPTGDYECWGSSNCIPNYWVCDGVNDCPYEDDEENCGYSTMTMSTDSRTSYTTHPWITTSTLPPITNCIEPFEMVGGRCVLVEPFTEVTWMEARYLCHKFFADLVVFDSPDFFIDLMHYITENGLTNHDYWVGGTDEAEEQDWRWINGQPMLRGTPLWAVYCSGSSHYQEPVDSYGDNQDCAYLDKERFFYMDDDDCDSQKATICQISPWTIRQQHSKNTTQENDKLKQEFIKMISKENKKVESLVQKTEQQHRRTAVKRTSEKERKPTHETVLKHKKIARVPKTSLPENKSKHQEEAPAEPLPVQLVKAEKEIVTTAQAENHHVHRLQDEQKHLLRLQAENQHA